MVFHEICLGQHFILRLLTISQANCTSFSACRIYKTRWAFPESGRSKKTITSEKLNMQVVKLCINILMATYQKSVSASYLKNQWSANDICSKCAMLRIYNAGGDSTQQICDMVLKSKSFSLLWIKSFVKLQRQHHENSFNFAYFLRHNQHNSFSLNYSVYITIDVSRLEASVIFNISHLLR